MTVLGLSCLLGACGGVPAAPAADSAAPAPHSQEQSGEPAGEHTLSPGQSAPVSNDLPAAAMADATDAADQMPAPHEGQSEIELVIGDHRDTIKLYAGETADALLARLPMSLSMNELYGNEKYHDFPFHFPAEPHSPGYVESGDLMLYGTDCLVLFY